MKLSITIYVIAVLLACALYVYFFTFSVVAICFSIFLIIGGIFAYMSIIDRQNRKRWKENPVLPDSPEFDDFFWQMTLLNQDWYIDNILKKDGLKFLLEKYESQIRQIWQEPDMEPADKIAMSNTYVKRLQALLHIKEFNYELK